MESFSVRALVRRVKVRPAAIAARSATAAIAPQSQVLERAGCTAEDAELTALTGAEETCEPDDTGLATPPATELPDTEEPEPWEGDSCAMGPESSAAGMEPELRAESSSRLRRFKSLR